LLGLCLAVPDARSDDVPGRGARDFWYWSHDTAPIEIFLGGNKREGWTGAQGHTIHLPRAMVYFAAGYEQPDYPRLPDRIETSHIAVQLAYPDGAPLSVALAEAGERTGMSEESLVGSDDFRLRTYSADLFSAEFGVVDEEVLSKPWRPSTRKNYVPIGEIDGLQVLAGINPNEPTRYYIGNDADEFYFVMCTYVVNPNWWCAYKLRVNEDVRASVSFADFRANGGRAFVNDRVRAFRRALCRYVECQIVATDGSLIRREQK
jgi:hypothetical protein